MVRRIPLSRLLLQDDEPPMHWPSVLSLLNGERTDDRPLDVEPVPGGFYRIKNGRHRFAAAMFRGEYDIRCDA